MVFVDDPPTITGQTNELKRIIKRTSEKAIIWPLFIYYYRKVHVSTCETWLIKKSQGKSLERWEY